MEAITGAIQKIMDFIYDCFMFIIEIPYNVVLYVFELWLWLQSEMLAITSKFLIENLSKLFATGGYDVDRPTEILNTVYEAVNFFIPLDDILMIGMFLLETYILVKVFGKLFFLGMKYVIPRNPLAK